MTTGLTLFLPKNEREPFSYPTSVGPARDHQSYVSAYAIDPTNGDLHLLQSNNIVVFRIDPGTGKLAKTGEEIMVDTPVCLQFALAGPQ